MSPIRDDALRGDQGLQVCACGDLTVETYQGRPCCRPCYPERRRSYEEQRGCVHPIARDLAPEVRRP